MVVQSFRPFGFLIIFLTLMVSQAFATGGAWNRAKRGYYIKIGIETASADEEFDRYANRHAIVGDSINFRRNTFGSTDIALYMEYGLADWFTATLSTQFKFVERTGESVFTHRDSTVGSIGPGDIWVGARLRLLPVDSRIVGAITVALKMPTGTTGGEIALGTGAADYEGALAFGAGWNLVEDVNAYAQISAGYRLRGRGSKELNYLAELGVSPLKDLILHGVLEGVRSQADFDQSIEPDASGFVAPLVSDQSFMRWRAGLIYALDGNMDLNIGYSAIVSGRNALALTGPSVGIAFKQ